jgi:hypothetical protein
MIRPLILVADDAPDQPDAEDLFWARRIVMDAVAIVERKTGRATKVAGVAESINLKAAPGYTDVARTDGIWRWCRDRRQYGGTTVAYYWGPNKYDLSGKGAPVTWPLPGTRETSGFALVGRNAIRMARLSRGYSSTTTKRVGYWMAVGTVLHELGHGYGLPHAEPLYEPTDSFMSYRYIGMAEGTGPNRNLATPEEWGAFVNHRDFFLGIWPPGDPDGRTGIPDADIEMLLKGYPPEWGLWLGPTIADKQFWVEAQA